MTLAEPYEGQALLFLREGTGANFTEWGHEFQLQLCGDVADEYQEKIEKNEDLAVRTHFIFFQGNYGYYQKISGLFHQVWICDRGL